MDEAAVVLDAHGLGVQIDNSGGFMLKHGAVKIAAVTGAVVVALGVIEGGGGTVRIGMVVRKRRRRRHIVHATGHRG